MTAPVVQRSEERDTEDIMNVWCQGWDAGHGGFVKEEVKTKVAGMMREQFIPQCDTFVCEVEGVLVGFVAMLGNEIGGLFVLPSHHGRGLGRLLVDHVAAQHPSLEVEVFAKNALGLPFYKKYGFTAIKEYHNEFADEDTIRMKYEKK